MAPLRIQDTLQAALNSQGAGHVGHGRTVEQMGDRLVVSFGTGAPHFTCCQAAWQHGTL